jgi:mannose-6-phosphate isomerase-like protein (cupin superfamily)
MSKEKKKSIDTAKNLYGERSYMSQVKVIQSERGKRTTLPDGSWLIELLTGSITGTKKMMLGFSTFKPGADTEKKIHTEEECAFIISGSGKITLKETEVEFGPRSAIYIPPGVSHGVKNDGSEDVVMVYTFSYPEYPPTKNG